MDEFPRVYVVVVLGFLLASCGGSGTSGFTPAPAGPDPDPTPILIIAESPFDVSPGGIWETPLALAFDSTIFYISETGKLISSQSVSTGALTGNIFYGSGEISVSSGDEFRGEFEQTRLSSSTVSFRPATCGITGTLIGKASLNVTIDCTDTSGLNEVQMLNLVPTTSCDFSSSPPPGTVCTLTTELYDELSSLAELAGTYQDLSSSSDGVISISPSGVITGSTAIGSVTCEINGFVSIVDSRYNLYGSEWDFVNCLPAATNLENAHYDGFISVQATTDSRIKIMMSEVGAERPTFWVQTYTEVP